MQLPTSLASDYTKVQALDMSSQYYAAEPPTKYPTPPNDSIPYTMPSSTHNTPDTPGIVTPTATAMFSRFPYDRIDIQQLPKPGYEPENLSTTEAFMRQYSTGSVGSCPNVYSPQDRLHAVHQQSQRGFPPSGYPSPQSVMTNSNSAGLPIFPWMRTNMSGK